jgi:hypothetical protein
MICLALALAGILLLAGPGWAQNRGGKAAGPAGPGLQMCTPGQGGVCAVNPPDNPGNQNSPSYGADKSQRPMGKGRRGGGQINQPNTPANPPATSQ